MTDPSKWPLLGYFDSVGKIVAGVAALVALIGGIATLVHQLSPGPPPPRKATLRVERVRETSLGYYLSDSGQEDQVVNYDQDELSQVGNYYYVRVTVEGLRNRNSEIIWSLDRRDNGTPIEDLIDAPSWIHQLLKKVKPPANTYEFVAKVWIQRPSFPGKFYAILEIDYPENQTLGITETPSFMVEEPRPRTRTTFVTTTTVTTVPETMSTVVTTTDGITTTTMETVPPTTSTILATVPIVITLPRPSEGVPPTPRPKAAIVPGP